MSGVCGYERRCGDPECPYSVCVGCLIADALDFAGIDKTDDPAVVLGAMDAYMESDEVRAFMESKEES